MASNAKILALRLDGQFLPDIVGAVAQDGLPPDPQRAVAACERGGKTLAAGQGNLLRTVSVN